MSKRNIHQETPQAAKGSKHRHSFVDLPGEIRNRIYAYYYDDMVTEFMSKRADYALPSQTCHITDHVGRRMRRSYFVGQRRLQDKAFADWQKSSMSLLLTSHWLATEAAKYLYQETQFYFQGHKFIKNFIRHTAIDSRSFITKLTISYRPRNSSRFREDEVLKVKEDANWDSAFELASKSLPNLRELYIAVFILASPFRLTLGESWARTVLRFHIGKMPLLEEVGVSLSSSQATRARPIVRSRISPEDPTMTFHRHVHDLFAGVLRKKISGLSDEEAVREYREALFGDDGALDTYAADALYIVEDVIP